MTIIIATNMDLAVACDPERSREVRAVAWEKYEVDCWLDAYRERGLLIRNMDNEARSGPDGESMQLRVMRRMRMPVVHGIDTSGSGNPLR